MGGADWVSGVGGADWVSVWVGLTGSVCGCGQLDQCMGGRVWVGLTFSICFLFFSRLDLSSILQGRLPARSTGNSDIETNKFSCMVR